MKRLGIFVCFDKDGVIDDYVTYLLDDISQNLDELCIISKGTLINESVEKLKKHATNDIIYRLNDVFDVDSFKYAMVNHYGFKKISEFDEVILFNDSFFGPIYPFKNIFDKMDNEIVDFWGITNYGETLIKDISFPYDYGPKYLQTYFIAFRKNLVSSSQFQKYWSELPNFKNSNELTLKHEAIFTKQFEDLGFEWKSYIDLSDLEVSREDAMDLYSFDIHNLLVNKNLPIINRDAFKFPREIHLKYNVASDLSKTIDYLKKNTNYDISLIYKHFLRILDPSQFVDIFNLVKILPKNKKFDKSPSKKRILLIAHLHYDDLWEYDLNYFKNIPEYIDILITTNSDYKKEFFEKKFADNLANNYTICKINSRGRDMAALFVASRDIVKNYDYFCFMHDKKSSGSGFITVGATFRDILWENNLASHSYIENIINEFDENSSLGLIVPPKVYHGPYFFNFINQYWVANYDIVLKLLNNMNIKTPIDKKCPPLSIGNCFWARYDALKPLFDLNLSYEDFPEEPMPPNGTLSHALERIYGYVSASKGYYTEFVMTEEYARAEMFNLNYMLLETFSTIKSNHNKINYHVFDRFKYTLNKLLKENNRKLKSMNKKNTNNKKQKSFIKKVLNKIKQ